MRHTRKDVTERTQREFRLLDRLVKRLKPADWRRRVPRPETKDPWTVQDALAHIIYWKQHSAHVFRGEKRPSEMRGLEVNQINALIYRRWRNRRPADVVAWHGRVQVEVIQPSRPERMTGSVGGNAAPIGPATSTATQHGTVSGISRLPLRPGSSREPMTRQGLRSARR